MFVTGVGTSNIISACFLMTPEICGLYFNYSLHFIYLVYSKLQRYSPTDSAKVWDKPLNRKHGFEFSPKPVLELVKRLPLPSELDDEGRRQLIQDYIDVSSWDTWNQLVIIFGKWSNESHCAGHECGLWQGWWLFLIFTLVSLGHWQFNGHFLTKKVWYRWSLNLGWSRGMGLVQLKFVSL